MVVELVCPPALWPHRSCNRWCVCQQACLRNADGAAVNTVVHSVNVRAVSDIQRFSCRTSCGGWPPV